MAGRITSSYLPEFSSWVGGAITIVEVDGQAVKVRDAEGNVEIFPIWNIEVGNEYLIDNHWRHERESATLDAIERFLARLMTVSRNSDQLADIAAQMGECKWVLARNGRVPRGVLRHELGRNR
jgi:hypothetical protein